MAPSTSSKSLLCGGEKNLGPVSCQIANHRDDGPLFDPHIDKLGMGSIDQKIAMILCQSPSNPHESMSSVRVFPKWS